MFSAISGTVGSKAASSMAIMARSERAFSRRCGAGTRELERPGAAAVKGREEVVVGCNQRSRLPDDWGAVATRAAAAIVGKLVAPCRPHRSG
jgi:hypothetical protein